MVGKEDEEDQVGYRMYEELDGGAPVEISQAYAYSRTLLFARVDAHLVEISSNCFLLPYEMSSVRLFFAFGPVSKSVKKLMNGQNGQLRYAM